MSGGHKIGPMLCLRGSAHVVVSTLESRAGQEARRGTDRARRPRYDFAKIALTLVCNRYQRVLLSAPLRSLREVHPSNRFLGGASGPADGGSCCRKAYASAGTVLSVSATLSPSGGEHEDGSGARRRKAVQRVREARDRLTSTSGTRPAF